MVSQVIVFSHYGYSDYLEYTLQCARKTNPFARLIFLGDQSNKEIAHKHGWEHFYFENYNGDLNKRFCSAFRHIQGKNHNPIKNGKDWLRYVFERWFYIENFVQQENISRFWHFDSDTMILRDLGYFAETLSDFEFTVQCNNTCLNGLMNKEVVSDYCRHICDLFESPDYLAKQQLEFDTINPDYAFTEMRAFDDFKMKSDLRWANLMLYNDQYVFDDCICQEHGFQMTKLFKGPFVKDVHSIDGFFCGIRDGQKVSFVTLNLSWVPIYLFRWVFKSLDFKGDRSLRSAYPNLIEIISWLRAKLNRTFRQHKL